MATTFTPRLISSGVDAIPPLPPSTSQNIPLQVSSNEMCSVHVELEKSYFVNGETINGTVHLTIYQRQYLHSIQIHLGGFEKIYIQSMLNNEQHNTFNLHSNNHIIPFYSETKVIYPPSAASSSSSNEAVSSSSSTTSTSHSPTGSSNKLNVPGNPAPSPSSSSSNGNNNNLQQNNNNNQNPHTVYRYTAPSSNGNNNNNNTTITLRLNSDAKELEPGNYHYPFSIQMPRFLAPSLNYIDFLSIFYIAKCIVEYSKGREWQETSIARSTEFFVHGVGTAQLTRIMMERKFVNARVSRFLWTSKSRPVEMAVCLGDIDCFIGEKAYFYVQIRNPSSFGIDSLQLDFFQQIFLMLPGNANKQPLACTKMLTANFDVRNRMTADGISTAQFQVTIPQMVGDDVVYPSTRGCISRIKHYFKVSIPSAKIETILKFNLHGRPVALDGSSHSSQSLSPRTSQPPDWSVSWMPTWVRQEDKTLKCTLCAEQFNIIIRKHHCRSCGNVFCGKCASSKLYLKKFGVNERVRVCALCHDEIIESEEREELNTPKKRYKPHLVELNKNSSNSASSSSSSASSSNNSSSNSLNNSVE